MRIFYLENHDRAVFSVTRSNYCVQSGKGDELIEVLQTQISRPFLVAVSAHQAGNQALLRAGADTVCSKIQFSGIESVLKLAPTAAPWRAKQSSNHQDKT